MRVDNLKIVWQVVGFVAVTVSLSACTNGGQEEPWPPHVERRFLAAGIAENGTILAATEEPVENATLIRVSKSSLSGQILETHSLLIKPYLGLRAFIVGGNCVVGWLDAEGALWWATRAGQGIEQRIVIKSAMYPGGRGVAWYAVLVGKTTQVFISAYKPIENPKNYGEVHKGRAWLYGFELREDGPRLIGDACLQEYPFIDPSQLFLGADDGGVLLWQTYHVLGGSGLGAHPDPTETEMEWVPYPHEVMRVARWSGKQPKWDRKFVGAEGVSVYLDMGDASRVLVQEPKNGMGSPATICSIVGATGDMLVPLGSCWGPGICMLRAKEKGRGWAVVVGDRTRISLRTYDPDFNRQSVASVPRDGVLGFRLLADDECFYLLMLKEQGVAVRKCSPLK